MPAAAPRTRTSAPTAAKPGQKSGTVSIAAATRVRVPPKTIVQPPAGPAIKLKDPKAAKDPRFQKVMDKLQKSAAKAKEHPSPQRKAAEALAAAQPPANEKLAGAQANQVETMQGAETKKPEPSSFLALLRAEIEKVIPKKLGDTEKFMQGEKKQELKSAMTGNVNQQKEEASGGIKEASKQPPDPGKVETNPATPIPSESTPPPPAVGAADAMPTPKPEGEVSLEQGKQDANKQLKDAEVTPEQLQKANDPRFSAVLTAKSSVDKQADSAPKQYRSDEQKTLTQAAAKAVSDEKQRLIALQAVHGKAGVAVKLRQQGAKEKDEADRKAVINHIEDIYKKTKGTVEQKLSTLETDVSSMFDQGIEAAMQKMTDHVNDRMFTWKLERYLSIPIVGLARWLKDLILPLPDETKVFYEEGRKIFTQELDALVVRIAGVVEARLKEAKDIIAAGQQEIKTYVAGLAPNLQAVGKTAEKEISDRFEELQQSVDDKKNSLAQNLAQRYKEASDKANEKLKQMQDENKGLLNKLKEKLGEVIKILRDFKERISSMLKKGKETIMLIVAHPIDFLKNLINAIKKGIQQFADNIWTHLKAGFMAWLFGSLAEAGIEIPSDFSLGSILKLVLQVLGLTYDRIRAKAVKLIGERNVMLIEKAWELISALIKGGPGALWEKIKEFLGNLKEMVVNAIQDWVVTTVIKAAITKLATMFNPVGAIIQAILAIYNTVMFFIERINQILAFVEAIINSVHKIATGDISSAANWVEQALARTIPIIIGFLARLLGLSGISDKIKEIIKKIQDTVDKAIDKLIAKIVAGIGKLFGKGKAGDKDKPADVASAAVIVQVKKDTEVLTKKRYQTVEQFDTALDGIYRKYKPQGLKSLSVSGVQEDPEKPFQIIAEASPAEPVTLVKWKDLFEVGEEPKGGAEKFARAGDSTYAVLIVNGRTATKIVRSNEEGHAEDHILASDGWRIALEEAYSGAMATPPRETTIKLVINRTPCHKRCSKNLTVALQRYRARFSDPVARKRVNFYLIATGVYESKKGLESRDEGGPTTNADLLQLASAGWHLQGLQVREQPTTRGRILSEFIQNILNKLKRVKDPK